MVICLEWGVNLQMAQLMPMPLAVSCFSKIQIVLPFCCWLTQVVLDKEPLNRCVCVFLYICWPSLFLHLLASRNTVRHQQLNLKLSLLRRKSSSRRAMASMFAVQRICVSMLEKAVYCNASVCAPNWNEFLCQCEIHIAILLGWLGSRVVSMLDSGAEGPGFKSQSWRCRVTVLGKLFTPIVPLFTKQQNW